MASLSAGHAYSCTVTATNARGTGPASNVRNLSAVWVNTSYYDCPSGGSLSGSTCNVPNQNWVNTNVGANPGYSCAIGGWYNETQDFPLWTSTESWYVNKYAEYNAVWDGVACHGVNNHRRWASTSCYRSTSGFYYGAATGTCNTGNPQWNRRRRLQWIRDVYSYHSHWWCHGGYSLSGSTCVNNSYPAGGYWANPAYSYAARFNSQGYWNGWSVS